MLNPVKVIRFILILSIFNVPVLATDIFIHIDDNGKKVFSDTPPTNTQFVVSPLTDVVTTSWTPSKLNKITLNAIKQVKSPQIRSSDNDDKKCRTLSQNMRKSELKLRGKLDSTKFDTIKRELSSLKWQYQTEC